MGQADPRSLVAWYKLENQLFRRMKDDPSNKTEITPAPPGAASPTPPSLPPAPRQIPLSGEQKSILKEPVDPRVDRILKIYADKTAAKQGLSAPRIVKPSSAPAKEQVNQDEMDSV